MKKIITAALLIISFNAPAQNYVLKPGDKFPPIVLGPMINAPVKEINLSNYPANKLFIVNFWGTWCSPCIPEMDTLAKLQAKFPNALQVIGLSDDPVEKLKKYLIKKPSKIWLASDTASLLYRMLSLASVGQCVVINSKHDIVALLNSASMNENIIRKLIKGEKVPSDGEIRNRINDNDKDLFGVDSLLASNFTIRGYMPNQPSMGRRYPHGVFGGRRISFINTGPVNMYKQAYNITSEKQVVLEEGAKKYNDYGNKDMLYCLDLLVPPAQKDSLSLILQQKLQTTMPVKARIEMRDADVYILKLKDADKLLIQKSDKTIPVYGFSGNGFNGEGVSINDFASDYLSNELDLPVINDSGVEGLYNINTTVALRDQDGILKSINDIGFKVVKERRKIRMLILYTE